MTELALLFAYIFIGTKFAEICKENITIPGALALCILCWPFALLFWLFMWKEV